ncbi:MAG: hypothetical protein M3N95_06055 [Actinomycetota bacterium]|nr:hypothetical protein [Actinomycetota bacterium]
MTSMTPREQWQVVKQTLEAEAVKGDSKVKQLLKSFNQGLGPKIDKLVLAVKAEERSTKHDASEALVRDVVKVVRDYKKKLAGVPASSWAADHAGNARDSALQHLDLLDSQLQAGAKRRNPSFKL